MKVIYLSFVILLDLAKMALLFEGVLTEISLINTQIINRKEANGTVEGSAAENGVGMSMIIRVTVTRVKLEWLCFTSARI